MSREIKFRGKYEFDANALYPKDYRWVYGFYIEMEGEPWIKNGRTTNKVNPKSVGQFIGRLDINGKEIYTGDVVEGNLFDHNLPTMGTVVYDSEHSYFANKNLGGLTPIYKIACIEIIGNTFENPELVKP